MAQEGGGHDQWPYQNKFAQSQQGGPSVDPNTMRPQGNPKPVKSSMPLGASPTPDQDAMLLSMMGDAPTAAGASAMPAPAAAAPTPMLAPTPQAGTTPLPDEMPAPPSMGPPPIQQVLMDRQGAGTPMPQDAIGNAMGDAGGTGGADPATMGDGGGAAAAGAGGMSAIIPLLIMALLHGKGGQGAMEADKLGGAGSRMLGLPAPAIHLGDASAGGMSAGHAANSAASADAKIAKSQSSRGTSGEDVLPLKRTKSDDVTAGASGKVDAKTRRDVAKSEGGDNTIRQLQIDEGVIKPENYKAGEKPTAGTAGYKQWFKSRQQNGKGLKDMKLKRAS